MQASQSFAGVNFQDPKEEEEEENEDELYIFGLSREYIATSLV